jgi:polysaccharide export outer membrane protein
MKLSRPTRMLLAAAVFLGAIAMPAAVMAQKGGDEKPPSIAPADYKIGPEDVLTIITRDMPEASGDYMVRPDGTIGFPIAGTIKAAGLSPTELQAQLTEALKKELRDPVITVNVKQMRINRIYILGVVSHPGLYDFKPGWRLTELIASAGGLALAPERLTAVVFRSSQANKAISMKSLFVDGKDEMNVSLEPGDVVNVRSDPTIRINVVGSVLHPGQFDIEDGHGAVEAIAAAGGGTGDSALSRSVIHRGDKDIPVNLYQAMVKGDPKANVALQAGDSVYVPQISDRVSVVGTVQHPGTRMIPDGRVYTVTDAIADAGGLAPTAKQEILIAHQGADGKIVQKSVNLKDLGTKIPDITLNDRDVVFVPQSGRSNTGDATKDLNLWFLLKNLIRF